VKQKSVIVTLGSEIIASKCLENKKGGRGDLLTVSKEKNFTERLV
jgi:hypothetical protein